MREPVTDAELAAAAFEAGVEALVASDKELFVGLCRVLDDDDIRRAWKQVADVMITAMERL